MTRYRIEIDRSLCSGFGTCAELAPDLVALDDEGLATLRAGETDDPVAPELELSCPMGAIAVRAVPSAKAA